MSSFQQKDNVKFRLSIFAYFVMLIIYVITTSVSAGIKSLVPESYQLIYVSILAIITLLAALYERNILQKSIYALLIFIGLPLVLALGSIMLWLFDFPYAELGIWMNFAYWDPLLLFNLLIFFYLVRQKIIK